MRKVIWIILIISTIFVIPLINLRLSNEINNNSVVLALDYRKFELSNQLDLGRLRENGISGIILREEFFEGSNSDMIEKAAHYGINVIPNLSSLSHSINYYKNLESAIQKYSIRYLLIYNPHKENTYSPNQAGTDVLEELKSIITRNNLIFFTMENKEQNGYMPVPGLESLITGTNYSLNRAFTVSNHMGETITLKKASMMWYRAVVDRNIRLLCIEPVLEWTGGTDGDSFSDVLEVSKELAERLEEKGFDINTPIKKLNPGVPGLLWRLLIIVNLIASMALLVDYCGIKRPVFFVFITVLTVVAGCAVLGIIKPETNIWEAYGAAIIYPSLAGIVLLNGVKINGLKKSQENNPTVFLRLLSVYLLITGIGALIVIASMCDIRYSMHLINFNLVIPSFIIPVILFNINYIFILHKEYPVHRRIVEYYRRTGIRKFIFASLIYVGIKYFFIYVYLVRSGDFNVLPEFSGELKAREFLELNMSARPRAKEFLIGYPCMFAFLYLYPKRVPYKLISFLGTFSAIVGISIINSFCHGFTPIMTSLNRTINGLMLGIITGCISLAICWKLLKHMD